MKRSLCSVNLLTGCVLGIAFIANASDPRQTFQQSVEVPEFRSPQFPAYENDLIFGIYNPNGNGVTEIYRSRDSTEGFQLIASVPASDSHFLDEDVRPNTKFYYKLRAEVDGIFSGYSAVLALLSGNKLYPPLITVVPVSSTAIEVRLQDVSYNDTSYDLWRELGPDAVLLESISAPDSGEVFTILDTGLVASTQYTYRVDVRAKGPGNVFYPGMATASAATPPEATLEPPSLTLHEPPLYFTCGNEIGMNFSNPNADATTEIYRSQTSNADFQLIHTAVGSGTFVDKDLISKGTYYYKARSWMDSSVSGFTPVISKQTGHALFEPEMEITVLGNRTVQVTIRDHSYLDYSYELYGWNAAKEMQTINATFQLPDSGQSIVFIDTLVEQGETYTYHVNATLDCDGYPVHDEEFVSPAVTPGETLATPMIVDDPPSETYCESTIAFRFVNPNEYATTEIYRSTSDHSGFTLVATEAPGVDEFADTSVTSNTTYYYKLRAVSETGVSALSDVWIAHSPSDFYDPEFTAHAADGWVEITIHDLSYGDLVYMIKRNEPGTENWEFITANIFMPDSGRYHTFRDTTALPNKTYRYYLSVTLRCEGSPQLPDIAYVDVETMRKPLIEGFTLVDPATDTDAVVMYDSMEFSAHDRLNIRAEANISVQSVAFYINGVRYWGENQEPFALFGDRNGDYNRGRFNPGEYTLTAVPYPARFHTGEPGIAKTIFFKVTGSPPSSQHVTVFPNPAVEKAVIEITGEPDTHVTIEILDALGYPITRIDQPLDELGTYSRTWDTRELRKGVYYLNVKTREGTHTKKVLIK